MQILRFKLTRDDQTVTAFPAGARVLSVGCKPGEDVISIWALCNETYASEPRTFRVVGTGWKTELPESAVFLGTAFETTPGFEPSRPQTFAWHVFEIPRAEHSP